jgi:sugar transferase (PEP-CTERM system associated)
LTTPDAVSLTLGWRDVPIRTAHRLQLFRVLGPIRVLLKMLADAVCIVAALYVMGEATWLAGSLGVASTLACSAAVGLYTRRQRARWRGLSFRIAFAVVPGTLVAWAVALVVYNVDLGEVLPIAAFTFLLMVMVRLTIDRLVRIDAMFQRNVLVVGGGARASTMLAMRRRSDRRGYRVHGFVAESNEPIVVPRDQLVNVRGPLLDYAHEFRIDEIVVAGDDARGASRAMDLLQCRLHGIEVVDLTSFLEREASRVFIDGLRPAWVIYGEGFRMSLLRRLSRRALDLVVSLAVLAVAWPVMLLTALAIKIEDGAAAPILYRQVRLGLFQRRFQMYKFRSMRPDAESNGQAQWAAQNDDRVTRVGRFIRRTRIDELPQLFNVLSGEMSIVGPRPERPEFVADLTKVIPFYDARHSVKPGLTGWAQLCYPYGASQQDSAKKLEYDLFYVKNQNVWFDLSILLQTVETLVFGRGSR